MSLQLLENIFTLKVYSRSVRGQVSDLACYILTVHSMCKWLRILESSENVALLKCECAFNITTFAVRYSLRKRGGFKIIEILCWFYCCKNVTGDTEEHEDIM